MDTITIKQITDCLDNKDKWLSVAICTMMDRKAPDIITPGETKDIKIEVKFNGVEVSFTTFIHHLAEQYDLMVRESALEMIKEKLSNVSNIVSSLEESLVSYTKDKLNLWSND